MNGQKKMRQRRFHIPSHKTSHLGRGVVVAAAVLVLSLWGVVGNHVIAHLNPSLQHELAVAMHPALDVWIAPPASATAQHPMLISTPAGVRYSNETLVIPEGSSISAHLAEQEGDAPELVIDGDATPFTTDDHGDFSATLQLLNNHSIAIRRGWLTLASWKIKVQPDNPPQVAMIDAPIVSEGRAVRLSYRAQDDVEISDVAVRITPHNPMPGANNSPMDIALPVAKAKQIARVDFEDLTARPWAGQSVTLQIVATNQAGQSGFSDPVTFTLPERTFYHPLARVLIDERKKLLQKPDDASLRDEVANVMAGMAQEALAVHGDPVVTMALRAGAVRLLLERDHKAAISVNDMLWETATRIEDGSQGQAEHRLHDARQDLAKAIEHNAGPEEISLLSNNLQNALTHYLSWLSSRSPQLSDPAHTHSAKTASKKTQDAHHLKVGY